MAAEFLQFVFAGLTVGATYALAALGFAMVYNASGVINFAQGEYIMLGGMGASALHAAGYPLPIAFVGGFLLSIACGVLTYLLAIARARTSDVVPLIIITIGASLVIRGLVQVSLGKGTHALPPFSGETPFNIGGATVL